MQYAPEPLFDSGSPKTAPPAMVEAARGSANAITAKREQTARRVAKRLGIDVTHLGVVRDAPFGRSSL
jgi:cyclohexyl-isocyanide hydratase